MKEQLDFKNPRQAYGTLLSPDMKIHRHYFEEMVKMIGIQCIYKAPRKDKHYSQHGELKSNYQEPILTGCIFTEHPDQHTLKKMGWVAELQENASIISVPYDLPDLQQGALFIIPDTFNPQKGRVFRVTKLSASMIYPASATCEIVPEWENKFEGASMMFKDKNFTLLNTEDEWVQKELG